MERYLSDDASIDPDVSIFEAEGLEQLPDCNDQVAAFQVAGIDEYTPTDTAIASNGRNIFVSEDDDEGFI